MPGFVGTRTACLPHLRSICARTVNGRQDGWILSSVCKEGGYRSMRVLLVNNQIQLGGAETVVHQLLSRIPNARLLVAEGSVDGVEAMYPPWLRRLNHSRLHASIERWFPTFAWTNRRFAKLRRDWADTIHIYNFCG